MRKILSCVLVMVLLVSGVSLAVTPAASTYPYEKKIPGDADENNELTKDELVNAVLPYMLDEGTFTLDDVGDTSYVYAYWDGKPKTVVDMGDREVTLYRPVERVVTVKPDDTRIIVALGGCDKLAGVDRHMRIDYCICHGASYVYCPDDSPCKHICGGKFEECPDLGRGKNVEVMVSLRPDILFAGLTGGSSAKNLEEKTGVPAISTDPSGHDFDKMCEHIEFMGTVLDKEEEAEELISFCEEKIDKVREITSEIPDDEKPTVYFSTRGYGSGSSWGFTSTTGLYDPLDLAGGINVAKGISGSTVSKEQIIAWNPDIIIIATGYGAHRAGWTDPVESALVDPDFQTMDAIKNHSVYHAIYPYSSGRPQDRNIVAVLYTAKLLHPDKFPDLDVEEEGNEVFERFLGVDGLFSEYARYLQWLREWLDEQKNHETKMRMKIGGDVE